ncbi:MULTISPECIES: DUF4326 domain-containing protein [Mycolicibacterium]|jgi:hypothetical protein|uniref:DUF4326 domain-containing protein n=3 Tax=Mycolicibacterium TaxID=1866885 RepID=A0AAE4VHN7_MYCFO|nr:MULTISPECIES: DUF4326 domain-containing protein [Mycolicibacterium]KLI04530.1 hypothetical protein AA982_29540 [Mycolicibacterium senegalense]KLO53826.1 hypothetical protein ABW05_22390 [Mycolicibacterium senegalense]KMV16362.1 hypothetical protein ACT17_20575 [Mycolicibacterium conceptionense]MDV7194316.1 DUF4326 domain-containing protein [Mycolicibacterium fortuitum]MDV7294265.1 DUF4326 domain-containing protein [Mycolicibacterium fortuitum]
MPERIQRKRTKGFHMPEGAIYVGRPTRWGNPWKVVGAGTEPGLFGGRERVYTIDGPGQFFRGTYTRTQAAEFAVHMYGKWINGSAARCEDLIPILSGHDLACWCPLDQPCHADVLLKLANGER